MVPGWYILTKVVVVVSLVFILLEAMTVASDPRVAGNKGRGATEGVCGILNFIDPLPQPDPPAEIGIAGSGPDATNQSGPDGVANVEFMPEFLGNGSFLGRGRG